MVRIFRGFSKCVLASGLAGLVVFPTARGAVLLERLEASVNNQLILKSDLARFRQTTGLRLQLDPLFNGTAVAAAGERATDGEIRSFLMDEKIIQSQFPMTDAEVEQEISSIEANNHITRAQLRQAIEAQGFPFPAYFELIRIGAAKRNLIDREIRTKVTVSEEEIRRYCEREILKGQPAAEAYRVEILTQKDRVKVAAAAKELRAGATFPDVAKKYGDESTVANGGALGTFTPDQMDPKIRGELLRLQPGEASSVLGDDRSGFFILRLAGKQAAEDPRCREASDQIRAKLASTEYQRQLQLWLERQRQATFMRRAGEPPIAGLPKAP